MILSLDPGLNNIGYTIYDHANQTIIQNSELTIVEKDLYKKLAISYDFFLHLFSKYQFNVLAFEKPTFVNKGCSGQNINFNLGTIISLAATNNCKIYDYSPKQIKKLCTGNGNADKKLVAESVAKYFTIENSFSSNHASDSLAVLLCYLFKNQE